MKDLESRIVKLEERIKERSTAQQAEHKPFGVTLGCPPEKFIGMFDHLLAPESGWHALNPEEKLSIVDEFCYQTSYKLTRHSELKVDLLNCLIAILRHEDRVRKEIESDEKSREEVWREGYEQLRGTVKSHL